MNVDRYKRGYNGSNAITWRGYAYVGAEIIEIAHDGVELIESAVASYYDKRGRRVLTEGAPAGNVLRCGHIPWDWIEHIEPEGDEYDGSPIIYVRYRAPGRGPYAYTTYRNGHAETFGANNRRYYPPVPELGLHRPQRVREWKRFANSLRHK